MSDHALERPARMQEFRTAGTRLCALAIGALAPSDIDHSGFVDTEDFIAFVTNFESGS